MVRLLSLRGLALAFSAFVLLGSPAPALAAEQPVAKTTLPEKEAYARKFAEMVLSIIHDTKKSFSDRKTVLREAFAKSVDIDWIARFVLGKGWSKASDEQKERYTRTYRRYLTETYVSNFAENPKKRIRDIKIGQVYDSSDEDFTVQTKMELADSENLSVNYLINESDGHYRVRDIAIEHISLINTHRAEISQMAVAQGIDKVIEELESRVENMRTKGVQFSVQRAGGI